MPDNVINQMHALCGLLEAAYNSGDKNIGAAALDAAHFLASAILDEMEKETEA